jgi:hypothetical protein
MWFLHLHGLLRLFDLEEEGTTMLRKIKTTCPVTQHHTLEDMFSYYIAFLIKVGLYTTEKLKNIFLFLKPNSKKCLSSCPVESSMYNAKATVHRKL